MPLKLRKAIRRVFRLPAPRPRADRGLAEALGRERGRWEQAVAAARGGPRVLVATSLGGFAPATTVEGLLAAALTLRGAEVHLLLCDRVLPACLQATQEALADPAAFAREGPQRELCDPCLEAGHAAYRPLGLTLHHFGDRLGEADRREAALLAARTQVAAIETFTRDGLAVGEHALAGALRFYARGTLPEGPQAEAILRRYFEASLLSATVADRLTGEAGFEAAAFHHGIYVPQGPIGEVARRRGVRVVNWHVAYRKRRLLFSHGDSYHHTLLEEPVDAWEHVPWDAARERQTMEYLKSRWRGTRDWIGFHESPVEDRAAIARELGLDRSRPCIGMLTNVLWDARLHYRANAFPDMLDWALRTVRWFAGRPNLQLLIRVHPAEVRGTLPSRQRFEDELRRAFPELPPNVRVIPAASRVSTYAAMEACDSVLIYGTKTGVELAAVGIPVIVAGEAWIRNKGLTLDARTADEYFAILERLPLGRRMEPEQVQRARRYAYHFFFRRMIPLAALEPAPGFPPYRVRLDGLDDLRPGKSDGLDVVCDGILKGAPFVYPAESTAETFE